MDNARLQIAQQQKEAQREFRNQVSDFAISIAGKLVGQHLQNDKAHDKLVDDLLNQIETKE